MELPLYQVDAFSEGAFSGNPAAVVPLAEWLPDEMLQGIAAENNLSETAFFCPARTDEEGVFDLRWFTPMAEVDLCGHATLASGYVLFHECGRGGRSVTFSTRSGPLVVEKGEGRAIVMHFPALGRHPVDDGPALAAALAEVLGPRPVEIYQGTNLMAVYAHQADIEAITYQAEVQDVLARAGAWGLIATAPGAPGAGIDFVSRFFAPAKGVPEDPVTGSAHCMMAPYWGARLGKQRMTARQLSRRGGAVRCEVGPDRVTLGGECTLFLKGTIVLPS